MSHSWKGCAIAALVTGLIASAPVAARGGDPIKDAAEARALFERAQIYLQQGAYKEAFDHLKKAEKKDKTNIEYRFATAEVAIKLHDPEAALDRYEKVYKADPANARALAGVATAHEEAQNYREAVRMWMRYTKLTLPESDRAEGAKRLAAARQLFADKYEIAENPAGGAENLLSPDDELKLGFQTAQATAMETPLLFDPEINTYVRGLAERLVSASKHFPSSYKLLVLDTSEVNAFATPGYIAVNRGILDAADNEAQLAGVLGHEIGHSVAHHVAKALTKQYKDQKQLEELQKQEGKLAAVLAALTSVTNKYGQLAFSRQEESQADRLGVHIAFDAGYDPVGLAEMFQKFESMSPSSRNWWDKINRTHPMSIDRINTVAEYSTLLPERTVSKTSPEFARMKARLKQLPPAPDAKGLLR